MGVKQIVASMLTLTLLSACATTTSITNDVSPKLDVKGLSQVDKIYAYENQLVDHNTTEYATFTNLQLVQDYRTASYYAPNPYGVYAVDSVPVKKFPMSLTGAGWYQHAATMATSKVKIPAGVRTVELGQITAWNRSDITLPKFNYQPNTDYIAVFEGSSEDLSVSVYTYEQDARFSRMDRDSIILKDKIVNHQIAK